MPKLEAAAQIPLPVMMELLPVQARFVARELLHLQQNVAMVRFFPRVRPVALMVKLQVPAKSVVIFQMTDQFLTMIVAVGMI